MKEKAPSGFRVVTEEWGTVIALAPEIDTALEFALRHHASFPGARGARRFSGGESGATGAKRGGGAAGRAGAAPGAGSARGRGELFEAADDRGRVLVVKALRRGGLPAKLGRGTYGRARLLAEMAILHEAAVRGVPTAPLVFGALIQSSAAKAEKPEKGAACLATVKFDDAVTLGSVLEERRSGRGSLSHRKRAIGSAGRAVRRAHDLGLDHADLNIGNILVRRAEPGGAAHRIGAIVIDLGVSALRTILAPGRRAANLLRLLRSAEKHLGSDPRRLRDAAWFLHGYLAGDKGIDRALRRSLLGAARRQLPAIAIHRLGWAISRAASKRR